MSWRLAMHEHRPHYIAEVEHGRSTRVTAIACPFVAGQIAVPMTTRGMTSRTYSSTKVRVWSQLSSAIRHGCRRHQSTTML